MVEIVYIIIELHYETSLDSMHTTKYFILYRTASSSDANLTNFVSQSEL
jgi:hypothetical protein